MSLEVEFITLGDASKRLEVPPATLRLWTDQLEEFEIHYVHRNNRKERIYYSSDIKIFGLIRDYKAMYGRKTTTVDLANMLVEKAEELGIELRRGEDAPINPPSNKTLELLSHEDIKQLMDSDRVKQFVSVIIAETNKIQKEELMEEVRNTVRLEMQESQKQTQEKLAKIDEHLQERAKQTDEWLTEMREREENKRLKEEEEKVNGRKSWWKRLVDN